MSTKATSIICLLAVLCLATLMGLQIAEIVFYRAVPSIWPVPAL